MAIIMTDSSKFIDPIINPNEEIRVSHGNQVDLHFEISLDNGVVIDSTFSRPNPVSLTIGDGSLLEGFEKVLINLRAGDTRTALLEPNQAFGEWNADNVQSFSKTQFALADGGIPTVGMMMEFEDKGKNTLAGVISEINDTEIKVDFNHPLAGQPINFKVQIFRVIPEGQTGVKLEL